METTRVEQIMIPLDQYPHIHDTFCLKDAMRAFMKCQIDAGGQKSLPRVVLIFNAQNELVGMVRRRDIMRGLEPDFLVAKPLPHRKAMFEVEADDNLPEMFFDKFADGVKKRSSRLVSAVMMPVRFTIKHDDHVLKAVYEMVDHNLALLPVMKGERVVGILRSVDVFRELTKLAMDPGDLDKPCCCVAEPK